MPVGVCCSLSENIRIFKRYHVPTGGAVARDIKLGSASSKFADWWAWRLGMAFGRGFLLSHTTALMPIRGFSQYAD